MNEPSPTPLPAKTFRSNLLLPYLAVFQADIEQTLRSWVYRTWLLFSFLVAFGYLLYRFGAYQEANLIPSVPHLMSDLLRWSTWGSITLILLLAAGSISSELGTLADSLLSRGISRHQYFLGKWHARLVTVLSTFFALGLLLLAGSVFLLRDQRVCWSGSLVALVLVAALLGVVITCGVTLSALCRSTLWGVASAWLLLYAVSFLLTFMPASWPAPDRLLASLPDMVCGQYDPQAVRRFLWSCLGSALLLAAVGLVGFSRRDV
jgi:ABC-2 type transport system permease protein